MTNTAQYTPLCPAGHLPLTGGDRMGVPLCPEQALSAFASAGRVKFSVSPVYLPPTAGDARQGSGG